MRHLFALILIAAMSVFPALAIAGSTEAAKPVLPHSQVAAFADRVQHDIASRGAHVAIVARVGRDPDVLPDGIEYTHVAFWVYSQITSADGSTGQGYQVYNLYQLAQDDTRSHLVQDTPANFFAAVHELDAGVIIPDPRMQERLLRVIASPDYANLHNPDYAVLANPMSNQFQNCTEHTLNVIMAGLYGTTDIPQIKANIAAYFDPQDVQIGGLKRFFAPTMSQTLTTIDHGTTISTATFGSISRFMEENGLASHVYQIGPDRIAGL